MFYVMVLYFENECCRYSKISIKFNNFLLSLCFASGHFFFLCVFPTDSDPDCSTDSQGGPSGLPQAMARAHPHSTRVCEGSGWPAAAQSTANLLSCHQNPSVQTFGTGQTAFPGCKSTVFVVTRLKKHYHQFFDLIAFHSWPFTLLFWLCVRCTCIVLVLTL